MKRLLRGSSSRSSMDKQSEEDKRPKYNLPRTAEVRPCEWPSDDLLRAAGIYDDFYELAENAGLTDPRPTRTVSLTHQYFCSKLLLLS